MDERISEILDLGDNPVAVRSEAAIVLDCARWAADAFRRLDHAAVLAIARAVTADRRSLLEPYRDQDFVAPRLAGERLEIPQPQGVVLALLPATDPLPAIELATLSCILTRNAVVFVPAPGESEGMARAIHELAVAAAAAGLPAAAIQVADGGRPALLEALLRSAEVDAILVMGDSPFAALARSAGRYLVESGSNDLPVFVDDTADLGQAAEWLAASGAAFGTRRSVVALAGCAAALAGSPLPGLRLARTRPQAIGALRALVGRGGADRSIVVFSRDPQAILDVAAAVAAGRVVVNPKGGEAGFTPEQLLRWTTVSQPVGAAPPVDLAAARLRLPGPLPAAPADGVPGKGRR